MDVLWSFCEFIVIINSCCFKICLNFCYCVHSKLCKFWMFLILIHLIFFWINLHCICGDLLCTMWQCILVVNICLLFDLNLHVALCLSNQKCNKLKLHSKSIYKTAFFVNHLVVYHWNVPAMRGHLPFKDTYRVSSHRRHHCTWSLGLIV
jgi:hypothetical protein